METLRNAIAVKKYRELKANKTFDDIEQGIIVHVADSGVKVLASPDEIKMFADGAAFFVRELRPGVVSATKIYFNGTKLEYIKFQS